MFVLYGLIDPDSKELRYVGYSSDYQERIKEHLLPSNLKYNTHKVAWIKNLLFENKKQETRNNNYRRNFHLRGSPCKGNRTY